MAEVNGIALSLLVKLEVVMLQNRAVEALRRSRSAKSNNRFTHTGRPMQGFATLTSATDMLAKLRHDRQRIRENNHDVYAAFDFFVTAYHILDWLHPDPKGPSARKAMRDSEPLLQLADHIANGAKHFVISSKRHRSVTSLEDRTGAFSAEASSGAFSANAFALDGLHLNLISGELIAVTHVAENLWERKLAHP